VIVETARGRVSGVTQRGFHAFLGVRYAASTAGAMRWRPPAPPEPWAGVREADHFGPIAPQNPGLVSRLFGSAGDESSEDCLSLNLWTPGPGRRPVLVWLHGGGFTTGSGSLPLYDGAELARRGDVVVVTLNYRLGALGFLHPPSRDAAANCGLLDQVAALEWLRENVAGFGGDPRRVTLFGQSAGAMCAGALLGAPRARRLFHRAILQSGAARNVHEPEAAAEVAEVFCAEAGCEAGDLEALRRLPVAEVLRAQAATAERLARGLPEPAFQPVIDGVLLPRAPITAIAEGEAADRPVLLGTNADEWRFYGLGDPRANALDEAGLLRRFRRGLPGRDPAGRAWAERVVETYREARWGEADVDPRALWFAIQTDRWFRHPAMQLAELQAAHQPATRASLFDWRSPAFGGALGACHALEVPFVFGAVDRPALAPMVGDVAAAARLSATMQETWLAFAHGEEPAAPGLPEWPGYEAGRRATLRLGPELAVVEAPAERERAFWDEITAGIIC
jgi:para-nitrobenzyl esterase